MRGSRYQASQYDYPVPKELIAQEPLRHRADSRLLVVNRMDQNFKETVFKDIGDFLKEGDVLVLNNTQVLKARLQGHKLTGGKLDVLLLRDRGGGLWEALVKPGKRARRGDKIIFNDTDDFWAILEEKTEQGGRFLRFPYEDIYSLIEAHGKVPLPPYIKKEVDDETTYQTIYAEKHGAVAAPTAGFHFTEQLLDRLGNRGVEIVSITLHCGLATFRPIKCQDIRNHPIGWEEYEISQRTASAINHARKENRRVIAVGTTSIRTLEAAAILKNKTYRLEPGSSRTNLYIYPGYRFKMVDAVITNFHTPCSTNLVLISTFAGNKLIRQAYRYAIDNSFRLFSFGDGMAVF